MLKFMYVFVFVLSLFIGCWFVPIPKSYEQSQQQIPKDVYQKKFYVIGHDNELPEENTIIVGNPQFSCFRDELFDAMYDGKYYISQTVDLDCLKQCNEHSRFSDKTFCGCYTKYAEVSLTNHTIVFKANSSHSIEFYTNGATDIHTNVNFCNYYRILKPNWCYSELKFGEPKNIYDNDEFLNRILEENPMFFERVRTFRNIPDHMTNYVLSRSPHLLKLIENPTEDQIKSAISKNPEIIKDIVNPSYEIKKFTFESTYAHEIRELFEKDKLFSRYGGRSTLAPNLIDRTVSIMKLIQDQPTDLIENILKYHGSLIRGVHNITENLCRLAVSYDADSIEFCPEHTRSNDICFNAFIKNWKNAEFCTEMLRKIFLGVSV